MRDIFAVFLLGVCMVVVTAAQAFAAENMIGRQTQNEGVLSVPAKGQVVIDGSLEEWDLSGQIWSFADIGVRDRFSVKTASMWDKENLYLSFYWKDPMPLNSTVNPDFNPEHGWKADALQLRVLADGQTSWITTWYYAEEQVPVMHVAYWKDESNNKNGLDTTIYKGKSGSVDLGGGIEMAYKPLADGTGFVQEVKIPWRVIYKKEHIASAGDTIRMGMEFLWGDSTGKTWPIHRYADNMQPGATSREFYWTAKRAWGDLTLLADGGIEPRRYVSGESKLAGTIPVRATLPDSASGFTLVIEDQSGKRIRNLAGSFDPAEYAQKEGEKTVEVLWDGLDDEGNPVAPGSYKVRGLTHGPLGAEYEMCFYNPGTPPWNTNDTSGAWGADHQSPQFLARAGDNMAVGWSFAEGGDGLLIVGGDGLKKWGEKRGVTALAADEKFIYAKPNSWHTKTQAIMRIGVSKGTYAPFVLGGKERPLELTLADIFAGKDPGELVALRVTDNELILIFDNGKIALLDKVSAELKKIHETGLGTAGKTPGTKVEDADTADTAQQTKVGSGLTAISKDWKTLFVNYGGNIHAVSLADGSHAPVNVKDVGRAGALATDGEGNLLIMDIGPDQQIKAFSADGKLVYTCAKKGGRPIRGAFDEQAVSNVSSIDVDSAGNVWATEYWEYPRRVSVWGRNGKLVRDYIGNTGYAGTGCFLHDSDSTRGYVGPVELELDHKGGTWKVKSVLWVPDRDKGETFRISTQDHTHQQVFYSEASGRKREYMFVPPYRDWMGYVILMNGDNGWRPVSYIGSVGVLSGKFGKGGVVVEAPSGEFAGCDLFDGVFWNDLNGDGIVQKEECEIIKTEKPSTATRRGSLAIPVGSGWGGRMDPDDLGFYVAGLARYAPERFTAEGAPVFTSKSLKKYDISVRGDLVPVMGENTVLTMEGWGAQGGAIRGIDSTTGKEMWRYPNPYPSVHGSHRATMPKAGLLIGPLKILGVVDMGGEIGRVFALRGNLGQDFYMTTDGLYVSAMFQDTRLPGMSLPAKEEQLKGVPLEMYSMGGEPFNGWLGRQDDGVVRMLCGLPRQAAMITQIKGLESIKRFSAGNVEVTEALLAQALQDNARRQAEAAQAALYTAKAWDATAGWDALNPVKIEREGQPSTAEARLGWDAGNLYARFEVSDPTPWLNEGKDYTRLFKTGDAVDIQLSSSGNDKSDPVEGDQRIVIAQIDGKPAAVLMRAVDRRAPKSEGVNYHSPVTDKFFARVKIIESAKVEVESGDGRYVVRAIIPWKELGMEPQKGMSIRADMGFILSDAAGTINTARVYWSNKETNLVNDIPFEAWLAPHKWGVLSFE